MLGKLWYYVNNHISRIGYIYIENLQQLTFVHFTRCFCKRWKCWIHDAIDSDYVLILIMYWYVCVCVCVCLFVFGNVWYMCYRRFLQSSFICSKYYNIYIYHLPQILNNVFVGDEHIYIFLIIRDLGRCAFIYCNKMNGIMHHQGAFSLCVCTIVALVCAYY